MPTQKKLQQFFERGLDRRRSLERSQPNAFYKLQNARLQKRGNTLEISRIEGYQQIAGDSTSFDVVYDSLIYDNDLVVYWYDTSSSEAVITFIDVGGAGTTEKRFASTQASYGELTLLEDNIYLTPYDKQLNNIGGTWYLNNFISTTPTFDLSEFYEGSIEVVDGAGTDFYAEGSIEITSQTLKVGSTATGSITIQTSASGDCTVDTSFYGETVTTNITNGDSTSTIALKIRDDLATNSTISSDWIVTVNSNVVSIESDNIGSTWNGYSVSLVVNPINFSWSTDSPTSGGEDNVLTLTFPDQPSDTVLTDTIQTSDTQEDIAQKITDAINNKSGLNYSATRNTTTVDIEATEYGQQYNGSIAVTQEGLDFTFNTNPFTGGYKATGNFFTISFSTSIADIDTQAFSSGDSNTQLAQYVYDALTSDSDFNDVYTAEINGNTIDIWGSESSTISVTEDITENNTTVNITDMQGGSSRLDELTYYWYKLRFVYYDGHKTHTSYPKYVKTGSPSKEVFIDNINFQTDLDQNLADIEVFRKKEGGEWFLIERVTPDNSNYYYVDDGKVTLSPLDERNHVWPENPQNQDIVRDRLVRANLEYSEKDFSTNHVVSEITASGDESLPDNTNVFVFAKGRFNDGTTSFHKQLSNFITSSEDKSIQINQTGGFDSNIKEIGFYNQYRFKNPTENDFIKFNTLEIYNSNIPSLATETEAKADQDRPISPHVFVGFKHILRVAIDNGDGTYDLDDYVVDEDWDTDVSGSTSGANSRYKFQTQTINSGGEQDLFPYYIDVTLVTGRTVTYKKKIRDLTSTGNCVYEIAWLEGLTEYIRNGSCNFYLNSIDDAYNLSSEESLNSFIDNKIKVVGFNDFSLKYENNFFFGSLGVVNPNPSSRFYLQIDTDSIYKDYDDLNFNNSGVLVDWGNPNDETPDFSYRATFGIDNSKYVKDTSPSTTTITRDGNDYTLYEYGDELIQQVPDQDLEDTSIFIGSQREDYSGTDEYITGFEKTTQNGFTFWELKESNIYEELLTKDDLDQFQEDYPNQLVWGGSYILESNASGTRDFEFTNFKNISQDYGEIVKISYINNILLVFCERGVNRINIGEVLTQQTDSQVFVDSSTLLNNDIWILKNVPDIKPRSIMQYENTLFFCDGKDVWQYAGGLENISNGRIEVDIDQEFVGAVDPKNKEYQLSNGSETWVYSIELDEWQGPFTYQIETASSYRDNFYGVIGSDSVEFNSGNTFDGTAYDTVVESVANTLDDASVTKLFRKFYIETEGDATFSYGKEYGTWTDKTLSNYPNKNGVVHIGVNPSNKNGRQLYWKITTQQQNFVLRLLSFLYQQRKRR